MTGVPVEAGAWPTLWAANLLNTEFLVTVGLLVLVLLGGAVVLHYTDLWRKRQLVSPHESAESLSSFRAMFERGEITEAEYLAVRDRVATRVKQEVALNNPSTAPSPNSSSPESSLPVNGATGVDSPDGEDGAAPLPPDPHPK